MKSPHDEDILFYAFWMKRNEDESHIAYGVDRNKFISGITITIILTAIVIFLLIANMLSLILYVSIGYVLYHFLYLIFISKYIGWYEVDQNGRPLTLISKGFLAPQIIKNRAPVSKKRFLQEAKYE